MSEEIHIEPDVLEDFARSSDRRCGQYGQVRQQITQVRVGRESFGKIPWISSKVYNAYDEHVSGCEDGLNSAYAAMSAIAGGVRKVISSYEKSEEASKDDSHVIERALKNTDIRGV